jgi:hypothetical protein
LRRWGALQLLQLAAAALPGAFPGGLGQCWRPAGAAPRWAARARAAAPAAERRPARPPDAQADALAYGKTPEQLRSENVPDYLIPHRTFTGNRPSMSILLPELDAFTVGQLLSLYEHRVAVQVGAAYRPPAPPSLPKLHPPPPPPPARG